MRTLLDRWPARGILLALVLVGVSLPPAAAQAHDGLNDVSVLPAPYAAAPTLQRDFTFDTSAYTVSEDERVRSGQQLSCNGWVARTGWVRLATAAAGRLRVSLTASFDTAYHVFTAPGPGPAAAAALTDVDCQNDVPGPGTEEYFFTYLIPAGQVIYVQAGSICKPAGTPARCTPIEEAAAPGGPVTLRLTFTPDNVDADATPDSLDACPTVPGPAAGCPDGDGDGVADRVDACPAQPGRAANGCRLPDEDGDGYSVTAAPPLRDCDDDRRDVSPAAREIVGNDVDENCDGLKATDRDADGVVDAPAGPDCRPADARIPGREVAGNAVDEDCDGVRAPFPRLDRGVRPDLYLYGDGVIRPRSFTILDVARGDRVDVECRGIGCPFSGATVKVRRSAGKLRVATAFARATRLAVGARVTLRITRPRAVGRLLVYRIRRGARPAVSKGCLAEGSRTRRTTC